MANRRVLVKRRRATQNIRKITRTMQLIATARFQAAFKRAVAGRPYTEKLTELTDRLASATTDVAHPLMRSPEATAPPLLPATGACVAATTPMYCDPREST
jgi:F-type H+-transporting ATPase subunit gamma